MRLQEFCDGKIVRLEELEEALLDFCAGRTRRMPATFNDWNELVTAGLTTANL